MILYFLLLGIGSILVIGYFSFVSARNALLSRTYNQLTSLRIARTQAVGRFFDERLSETSRFADSEEVQSSALKLIAGNELSQNDVKTIAGRSSTISSYYKGFGFADNKGKILYWHKTIRGAAKDAEPCVNIVKPTEYKSFLIDYNSTKSLPGNPLIVAGPVEQNGITAAYFLLEIDANQINEFMLEVRPENGLGYSGETYLVGRDFYMRSQSRFLSNSVMKTRVITTPVRKALLNESGLDLAKDYRGIEVLSSFGLLRRAGLEWAILAELDYSEATASVYSLRNSILMLSVVMGLAFFILTYFISTRITRPVIELRTAAIDLGEGRLEQIPVIKSDDELGELAEAFSNMAQKLQDKDRALKAERISRLRSAIDGQDQERQRLSRELHDGIGQSMIAIRLKLGALENNISEQIKPGLVSAINLTDNLIDDVRAMTNALMPPALSEFGITSAVRSLCSNLTENYGIKTIFEGEIPDKQLGKKARLYIFRIFQEIFNNVARHSGATELRIVAETRQQTLLISIEDNGRGFAVNESCPSNGHGLNNIRERIGLLRGKVEIISAPDKGTVFQIELPLIKGLYDQGTAG